MDSGQGRRPSPALLISMLALVLALTGSALALPGKNKVDKNDIQKGAVTKKAIKKNAVTKKAVKNGAITSGKLAAGAVTGDKVADGAITGAKIAAGAVGATQIADSEARRVVGASGQPDFGTGVDNDCIWSSGQALIPALEPVSFYKDALGIVHLNGLATATNGPGGDGMCGGADSTEDEIVYTLPEGYRPEGVEIQGPDDAIVLIAGDQDLVSPGISVPAGSVVAANPSGTTAAMDGITFRPAGPATSSSGPSKPQRFDLDKLRGLLR